MSIVDALRCTNKVGADHDCASCKWHTVEFCDQHPDVPIPADCEIDGRGAWVQCDTERIIDSAADLLEKLMEETTNVAPVVHGYWETEVIPPTCGSDTIKVVAVCSHCGCDDSVKHKDAMGYHNGTPIIWNGFITNYVGNECSAKSFAEINANNMEKRRFCPNCGARMDGGNTN